MISFGLEPMPSRQIISYLKLTQTFKISSEQQANFKYLGMHINQADSMFQVNQESYMENIQ